MATSTKDLFFAGPPLGGSPFDRSCMLRALSTALDTVRITFRPDPPLLSLSSSDSVLSELLCPLSFSSPSSPSFVTPLPCSCPSPSLSPPFPSPSSSTFPPSLAPVPLRPQGSTFLPSSAHGVSGSSSSAFS